MAKKSTYNDSNISQLKGADRVRLRPGVIFGSNGLEGCEHAFFEILSNSIDEAREGYGDKIVVTRFLDGSIEVQDFGRGLPVDYNEKEKRYNWELVFCELYAGSKYDTNDAGGSYEYSLGLNGLGLTSTQYASEYMDAEIFYGGHRYEIHFKKGEVASELIKEHILLQAALLHGLDDMLTHGLGTGLEEVVGGQTFLDDLADGHTGVQGGVGILEDDLQVLAEQTHLGVLKSCQVDAVVAHFLILLELLVGGVLGAQGVQLAIDDGNGAGGILQSAVGSGQLLLKLRQLASLLGGALALGDLSDVVVLQLGQDVVLLGSLTGHIQLVLLQHQVPGLAALVNGEEAAQDLDDVGQAGLGLAAGQVAVLQQVEVGIVLADLGNLLLQLGDLGLGLLKLLLVLVQVLQGVLDVGRSGIGQGGAIVDGGAGGLGIQLQQHASQSGLAAAGLADDAQGLALVDVQGDVLIGADIQLLLLEHGGLGHREILLKIRDGQ